MTENIRKFISDIPYNIEKHEYLFKKRQRQEFSNP